MIVSAGAASKQTESQYCGHLIALCFKTIISLLITLGLLPRVWHELGELSTDLHPNPTTFS